MAQFSWGSSDLSEFEVALLVDFATPVQTVLLVSLRLHAPSKAAPLFRVRADGVARLPDFLLQAELIDSKLGTFPLSGGLVAVLRGSDHAYLGSIGGFSPHFTPPANVPAVDRLRIDISNSSNPRVRLEAYAAITSQTFQLGARLQLHAAAGPLALDGWLAFDGLVAWEPHWGLSIEIAAGLSLSFDGSPLMEIAIDILFEGPGPWHIHGYASLSLLFYTLSLPIEEHWGDPSSFTSTTADPLALVREALSLADAWSAPPPAASAVVALRPPSGTTIPAHPLAVASCRQRIVPLGLQVTHVGNQPLASATTVDVTGLSLGGLAAPDVSPVTEGFAAGQFLDLTDDEKLFEALIRADASRPRVGRGQHRRRQRDGGRDHLQDGGRRRGHARDATAVAARPDTRERRAAPATARHGPPRAGPARGRLGHAAHVRRRSGRARDREPRRAARRFAAPARPRRSGGTLLVSGDSGGFRFISHQRSGLIALPGVAASGTLDASAVLSDGSSTPAVTFALPSVGDVLGLDPTLVTRQYPRPGATDAETEFFPLVEFSIPELPWLLPTPTGAHGPIPWLCLVAVEVRDGVSLVPGGLGTLDRLQIDDPAKPSDELPDPADSVLWAHAFSATQASSADGADPVETGPVAQPAGCRLLAARRLQPQTSYIACLVPTFAAAALAGLGRSDAEVAAALAAAQPNYAWSPNDPSVELPVYLSWEFSCSATGDFESLARALGELPVDASFGTRPLDLGLAGPGMPATTSTTTVLRGALTAPGIAEEPAWPSSGDQDQTAVDAAITAEIEEAAKLTRGGRSGG